MTCIVGTVNKEMTDKEKVEKALSAAAYFSVGVEKPFNFIEMTKKDSIAKSLVTSELNGNIKRKVKINRKKLVN